MKKMLSFLLDLFLTRRITRTLRVYLYMLKKQIIPRQFELKIHHHSLTKLHDCKKKKKRSRKKRESVCVCILSRPDSAARQICISRGRSLKFIAGSPRVQSPNAGITERNTGHYEKHWRGREYTHAFECTR